MRGSTNESQVDILEENSAGKDDKIMVTTKVHVNYSAEQEEPHSAATFS